MNYSSSRLSHLVRRMSLGVLQRLGIQGIPDHIPSRIARLAIHKTFPLFQRLGVHVVPNHFYEPVPDTSTLSEAVWAKPSELVGIDLNVFKQLELLRVFSNTYRSEYEQFRKTASAASTDFYLANTAFGPVDAEILYCIIRHFKPQRIFEIGSGYSTLLAADAVLVNKKAGFACELVAFEPYPNETLVRGFPGLNALRRVRVQDVPVSEFQRLQANDILFIDSSHVLKTGSDVQFEFLEILPRLNPGVLVHFHDIFLPAEYPKDWVVRQRRFWTEQYILQSFLAFNAAFETIWAASFMHLRHPSELAAAFSSYHPAAPTSAPPPWPGSFWIRRKP